MMANSGLNCAVVFAVPDLLKKYHCGVFFFFAGVCFLSAIIVDLWLPETSGQNLEDIANTSQENGVLRGIAKRIAGKRDPDRSGPLLRFDSNTTTATTAPTSSLTFSTTSSMAASNSSSFSAADTYGENTSSSGIEADKSATPSLQLESAMMTADEDEDECSVV